MKHDGAWVWDNARFIPWRNNVQSVVFLNIVFTFHNKNSMSVEMYNILSKEANKWMPEAEIGHYCDV